jgi:nucleoside-diphosphate-sugar epimerase
VGRALVTGASGFIGRALVDGLVADGWAVVTAGRRPSGVGATVRHVDWSLGDPLGADLAEIDVAFHCASATIAARRDIEAAMRLDVAGTRVLIEQCRGVSPHRSKPLVFVFISSQSSSPQAGNAYGQSKYAIDQMLTEPNEAILRPGLVYDATGTGIYGTALKLIRSIRFLPKFRTKPSIQAIHVDDLVSCLIRVAERHGGGTYCLGSETPLDFVAFCRRLAAREGLRAPLFVPFSGLPTQYLLALAARIGMLSNLHERIAGLIALRPMDTAASLARLGVRLRDF